MFSFKVASILSVSGVIWDVLEIMYSLWGSTVSCPCRCKQRKRPPVFLLVGFLRPASRFETKTTTFPNVSIEEGLTAVMSFGFGGFFCEMNHNRDSQTISLGCQMWTQQRSEHEERWSSRLMRFSFRAASTRVELTSGRTWNRAN